MRKTLAWAEVLLIIILSLFPLMGDVFPYRLNIFLSYEGAYRLYLGQIPYKDFGLPMGFMYWVIPAIFFKIFGPAMMSLVKAQVFINILSGLAFRSILKNLSVSPGVRFLSVLLFLISYSFLNYWPWYNHTVIVYEFIALAFLTRYLFTAAEKRRWIWAVLSGLFVSVSFFTKQDAGAMTLLICLVLLIYHAITARKGKGLVIFLAAVFTSGLLFILPFTGYHFGYWFNYGQPPHTSRFSSRDFIDEFFNESQWLKFYVFIIVVLLSGQLKHWRTFLNDHRKMIFLLLTMGIIVEAAIFQVTSYIPADNNIFFHSFAIAYILTLLSAYLPFSFESFKPLLIGAAGIMLWWSSVYWKFVDRYIIKPSAEAPSLDVVNKKTYAIFKPDTSDVPLSEWRTIPLKSFHKMLMPGTTVDGINRIMRMDIVKNNPRLKVLNMTELTPLATEMGYELEKGSTYPLWYHKGVGMFRKETIMFCNRIRNNYYDLVLFEYIPYLNNFYPFEVRDCLLKHYEKVDMFTAPRKPSLQAWVEVYVKKTKRDTTPLEDPFHPLRTGRYQRNKGK